MNRSIKPSRPYQFKRRALAPPVQPLQQGSHRFVVELVHFYRVPLNRIVVVIPTQFEVQLLKQDAVPQIVMLPAPVGVSLE